MTTPEIILLILRLIIAVLMGLFIGMAVGIFKRIENIEHYTKILYDLCSKENKIVLDIITHIKDVLNHVKDVISLNKTTLNDIDKLNKGIEMFSRSYNNLLDYNENYLKFIKANMVRRKNPIED